MIAFLQVLSSVPSVMESVPWPELFMSFAVPLTAINLNFMGIFSIASCSLSVLFPHQFIISMGTPIVILIAVLLAYCASGCCAKDKSPQGKQFRIAKASKIVIVILLFIYPGLCEKVFTMLRCKTIDGISDGQVLVADWSVRCGQGEHVMYSALAFVFMGVYILGIPLTMLILLSRNRAALYDKSHPNHKDVYYRLGGLYSNFEQKYYWFE